MIKRKEVMKDNLILETIFSCDKKDLLFFDIETTGFSPENSVLYLIGFICFEEGEPVLHQWFSEKKEDEKTLILEFYQLAHTKKILISYNGTTFDLRYLKKRGELLGLEPELSPLHTHLDFYPLFKPLKALFRLKDRKQPTFENFLDFQREDDLNGGELLSLYVTYLKKRMTKEGEAKNLYELFIKHNRYDLRGLFLLSKLYPLGNLISREKESSTNIELKKEEKRLLLSLSLSIVPDFTSKSPSSIFSGSEATGLLTLALPIEATELKYFYNDYKNYYYLPKEDMAVHKSLALYVEKEYREKASPKTSYVKKKDDFILLPEGGEKSTTQYFKKEYEDRKSYIRLSDFLNHQFLPSLFLSYLNEHCLKK